MDLDVPSAWARSADSILRRRRGRILVLGAVDRGKSSYCAFLGQRILAAGGTAAVVDADVGQKDVGPPACITLGYLEPGRPLAALAPAAFYFVGAVSPVGHLLPMLVGARRLLDESRAAFTVINTTGLIHGAGRVLAGYLIEALRPDVIVAIARGPELTAVLRAYRDQPVLHLTPSVRAVPKTPAQRRDAREAAFRRYFAGAREQVLPLGALLFQRGLLFTGKPLPDPAQVHAERTAEGVVSVPAGFERDRLCGLADRHGNGRGLALIQGIDFAAGRIALRTPVPSRAIRAVQWGDLRLDAEGRELERAAPIP